MAEGPFEFEGERDEEEERPRRKKRRRSQPEEDDEEEEPRPKFRLRNYGHILACAPVAGVVLSVPTAFLIRQFASPFDHVDRTLSMVILFIGFLGYLFIGAAVVAGGLMWAYLGAKPESKWFRVATIGGIYALLLSPCAGLFLALVGRST